MLGHRLLVLLAGLTACSASQTHEPPHNATAPGEPRDALSVAERCAMVEAALGLPELRAFACGEAARRGGRLLVDVDMTARFARGDECASRRFTIYRAGEPTATDAVLRLSLAVREGGWVFDAEFFDPPNSPDDHPVGGGFDDTMYYCHFIGGRLARSAEGWRAWFDGTQ